MTIRAKFSFHSGSDPHIPSIDMLEERQCPYVLSILCPIKESIVAMKVSSLAAFDTLDSSTSCSSSRLTMTTTTRSKRRKTRASAITLLAADYGPQAITVRAARHCAMPTTENGNAVSFAPPLSQLLVLCLGAGLRDPLDRQRSHGLNFSLVGLMRLKRKHTYPLEHNTRWEFLWNSIVIMEEF